VFGNTCMIESVYTMY